MKGSWMEGRPETVYSSQKRLAWLADRIRPGSRVLELGCGTGVMITIPLAQAGYAITGLDRDEASIGRGREIAAQLGVDAQILQSHSLEQLDGQRDVVIVSEVLEHLRDADLDAMLGRLAGIVRIGGSLLVTVPNGYGWFEAESWVWRKTGLGRLIEGSLFERGIRYIKMRFGGYSIDQIVDPYLSSLDTSPHIQRFRVPTLIARLQPFGFEPRSHTGSGLFSGQLSNLLWTGVDPVTRVNNWLGDCCPRLASGFFVEFERR